MRTGVHDAPQIKAGTLAWRGGGTVELAAVGPLGMAYTLWWSTNLTDWLVLTNGVVETSLLTNVDAATPLQQKFYRYSSP